MSKMVLVNFFGGPMAGKTAMCHALTAMLKRAGKRIDFTGEVARSFILKGQTAQFDNQYYVSAKQYSLIRNLQRNHCHIALCDSPLRMQLVYADNLPYRKQLLEISEIVESQYEVINVLVRRVPGIPFDSHGRNQNTLEEAAAFDPKIEALLPEFDIEVYGDTLGDKQVFNLIMERLNSQS